MLGRLTGSASDKPSAEEKAQQFEKQFEELQQRCQHIFAADPSQKHTDASLRRFLRGYVTVDAAFNAIIKYNKWRVDFKVDNLSPDDSDILAEMALQKVHLLRNRDLKSRPVLYIIASRHITNERDLERLTKYTVYMLELTFQRLDESVIDNICIVFDLKRFTMANMDYQFVKRLIWLLGKYYPERLGVCLVYNAPLMFSGCWTVIRPWLNEVTASKVTFVSNEEELCKHLNPDCLPPVDD